MTRIDYEIKNTIFTPCYFSPLSEIPGSIELLENSLTYEGVQWRKIVECLRELCVCVCGYVCMRVCMFDFYLKMYFAY